MALGKPHTLKNCNRSLFCTMGERVDMELKMMPWRRSSLCALVSEGGRGAQIAHENLSYILFHLHIDSPKMTTYCSFDRKLAQSMFVSRLQTAMMHSVVTVSIHHPRSLFTFPCRRECGPKGQASLALSKILVVPSSLAPWKLNANVPGISSMTSIYEKNNSPLID